MKLSLEIRVLMFAIVTGALPACVVESTGQPEMALLGDELQSAPAVARAIKVPFEGAQPVDRAAIASNAFDASALPAGAAFGPFQIFAEHSGRCLDVTGGPGAVGNGALIQQWDCFLSRPANQSWYFVDTGDINSWYIVAANSGRCLDVRGGTGAIGNGARLQQWDCIGYQQSNQRWIVQEDSNISAAHSGRCLDVRGGPSATGNGAPIQQWDCFFPTTANQRWNLQ